jgi:hypothetical protein
VSTWTRLRYLDFAVAGFAFVAILLHDAAHLSAGRWYDIFWVCNVSAVLVAPGVILRSPTLCAVAFTWLMPGTVVWLLDSLVAGANILPTSWGVHVGGMLAALQRERGPRGPPGLAFPGGNLRRLRCGGARSGRAGVRARAALVLARHGASAATVGLKLSGQGS